QLHKSGYSGTKGIFVMDGDCRSLAATGGGLGEWSTDQIVERFLAEHSYVHFVTTSTYQSRANWTGQADQGLSNKVYWQRPFDQQLIDKFFPLLKKAFRAFPPVIESPNNAWRTIRNRQSIDRSCRL